jgi:hypothetical protein
MASISPALHVNYGALTPYEKAVAALREGEKGEAMGIISREVPDVSMRIRLKAVMELLIGDVQASREECAKKLQTAIDEGDQVFETEDSNIRPLFCKILSFIPPKEKLESIAHAVYWKMHRKAHRKIALKEAAAQLKAFAHQSIESLQYAEFEKMIHHVMITTGLPKKILHKVINCYFRKLIKNKEDFISRTSQYRELEASLEPQILSLVREHLKSAELRAHAAKEEKRQLPDPLHSPENSTLNSSCRQLDFLHHAVCGTLGQFDPKESLTTFLSRHLESDYSEGVQLGDKLSELAQY